MRPIADSISPNLVLADDLLDRLDVEILEKVADTPSAVVYLCRRASIEEMVALKVAYVPQGSDNDFSEQASLLPTLHHPNVVTCHQAGLSEEGQQYVVTEFIDGPNLSSFVERRGALKEQDAILILRKLVFALQYAFKQEVVHGALKPGNVLLCSESLDGEGGEFPFEPKISDLGILRGKKEDAPLDSLRAMSPEQLDGSAVRDAKSDIHALGCLFYFLLTKNHPFTQDSIPALLKAKAGEKYTAVTKHASQVSEQTQKLLRDMLAGRPEKRPTYDELLVRSAELLTSLDDPSPAPMVKPVGVRKAVFAVAIGAAVFVGAILSIAVQGFGSDSPSNDQDSSPEPPAPPVFVEQAPPAEPVAEPVVAQTEPEPEPVAPVVEAAEPEPVTEATEVAAAFTLPEPVVQTPVVTPEPTPSPLAAPVVPIAAGTEAWVPQDFGNLIGRLPTLQNAVIYMRVAGNTAGNQFEKEVLLHDDVSALLFGREKIFVNVTDQHRERMSLVFKTTQFPALVVYNNASSVTALPIDRSINLTSVGLFLMSATE